MIIKLLKIVATVIVLYINFSLIKNANELSLKYKGMQVLDPSCIRQVGDAYNNEIGLIYYEYINIHKELVRNPVELTKSEFKLLELGESLEIDHSRIDPLIDRDMSKSFTLAIIFACVSIVGLAFLWELGDLFFEFIIHLG